MVEEEVYSREGQFKVKTQLRIYILIVVAIVSSLVRTKKYDKSTIFLVNLQKHPISKHLFQLKGLRAVSIDNRIFNIILGKSLIELDAIYYVLHEAKLPKTLKKIILNKLLNWSRKSILKTNSIYFIHEDYYGKCSILTTLSQEHTIKTIGIQHGLMDPEIIRKSKIYPGVRTRTEFVLNKNYKDIMKNKKMENSETIIAGNFIFSTPIQKKIDHKRRITFISSGDLAKEETSDVLEQLQSICLSKRYELHVRPHPSEKNILINNKYTLTIENKNKLLNTSINNNIFIGFYSTLLYEANIAGYKTIWLLKNNTNNRYKIDMLEIQNALILKKSDLSHNLIENIFKLQATSKNAPIKKEIDAFISIINNIKIKQKNHLTNTLKIINNE